MEIHRYKQQLLARERELVQKIDHDVEATREPVADQPDPVDQAVVSELRDEYFTRANTDSETLANVRAALERVENGTFGRCVVDGGPIEDARLEAVPWTSYCARHQKEVEDSAGVRTPRA